VSRVGRKISWLGTPSVFSRRPQPYHHIYPYLTDIIRGTRTYHTVSTYMHILVRRTACRTSKSCRSLKVSRPRLEVRCQGLEGRTKGWRDASVVD